MAAAVQTKEMGTTFDPQSGANLNGNQRHRQPISSAHDQRRSSLAPDTHLRVTRAIFTQPLFDDTYGLREPGPPIRPQQEIKRIIKKKWRQTISSNKCRPMLMYSFLTSWFPLIKWLPKYDFRNFLFPDIIAGITVSVMNVPQGIAYAILAGVPPVSGLYTSFIPVMFYFAMGTSRQCSLGTLSVVSMMTSKIINLYGQVDTVHHLNLTSISHANHSSITDKFNEEELKTIRVAGIAAFMVGVWQLLFGILRCGALTVYFSDQLVQGFSCGAAFHVLTSQLTSVFGLSNNPKNGLPEYYGPFKLIKTWIHFFSVIQNSSGATVLIAAVSMIILVIVKSVINTNKRIRALTKVPVPGELIVIIIGASVSYAFNFEKRFHVKIVNKVPTGLPPVILPEFSLIPSIIGDTLAIALVGFAMEVTIAMLFANRHNYSISPNQELRALGVGNIFGSFFCCFPSGAAISRSTVQNDVGGRTQLVSLFQCGIILVVIMALGRLLEPLPKPCLGAIIMVALINLMKQVVELYYMWRVSFVDFTIFLVVFMAVLILDVDYGIIIGMVYAIMTVMFRLQKPKVRSLGRLPGTDLYKPMDVYVSTCHIPGVRIIRVDAPIYFANAAYIKTRLYCLAGLNRAIHLLKIKKEDTEEDQLKNYAYSNNLIIQDEDEEQQIECEPNSVSSEKTGPIPLPISDLKLNVYKANFKEDKRIRFLILDCSEVCFIDVTGVAFLKKTADECNSVGVELLLANANKSVQDTLTLCDAHRYITTDNMFVSIQDAVLHALNSLAPMSENMESHDIPPIMEENESKETKM